MFVKKSKKKKLKSNKNNDLVTFEELQNFEFEFDKSIKKCESINKATNKIESIFKEQSVNQITMHRKYLPEIFDADLLEISESDGLPTLKSGIVNHFWMRGITTKFYGNVIHFRDYYMKKLYNAIKNFIEDWQIKTNRQYVKIFTILIFGIAFIIIFMLLK